MRRRALAGLAALWLAACAGAPSAELSEFSAKLAANPSATAVLQDVCDARGLAPPGSRIVARRVAGVDKPADPAVRRALKVSAEEVVRYRRVELSCGDQVLSRADNWYRPGRLTAEMNRQLDETETPFGVVVRPLGFQRRLLASRRGGEGAVLTNRAVLATPDGTPFSLVVESYSDVVLGTARR